MDAKEYQPHNGNSFMADELLPCPFCGGEPELKFFGNDYTKSRKATIKCKKCRAEITNAALKHDSKWCAMVSIEDWNKREYSQHQAEERFNKAINHYSDNIHMDDWDVVCDAFRIASGFNPPKTQEG